MEVSLQGRATFLTPWAMPLVGQEAARFVSKHFVSELLKNEDYKAGRMESALLATFLRMDDLMITPNGRKELIYLKKEKDDDPDDVTESHAGCTANVVLIHKDDMYIANAGDSRSVLCRGGKAVALSKDHTLRLEGERLRIEKAGGFIANGRVNGNLNLTRSLGDLEFKSNPNLRPDDQIISGVPDVRREKLTKEDSFLIIGCDGIWDAIDNQDIVAFVIDKLEKYNSNLKKIPELLLESLVAKDKRGIVIDS